MAITRLNHAVLFVRDADAVGEFYANAFGFEELNQAQGSIRSRAWPRWPIACATWAP